MAERDGDDAAKAFATTFAPDRQRPPGPRTDWLWLSAGVVLPVAGVVIAATGVLGALGELPRNAFVGIRTADTLRSAATWRAAHRTAAAPLLLSALPLLIGGVHLLLVRPGNARTRRVALIAVLAFAVLVAVAAVLGVRAAAP